MALSLNDLKKGKAGKAPKQEATVRRMVRPWEDPTQESPETIVTTSSQMPTISPDLKERTNR